MGKKHASPKGSSKFNTRICQNLEFKVLRPLVAAGEKPSIGEFDFELEVDSGGSDDSELFKLLLKVCKQRN